MYITSSLNPSDHLFFLSLSFFFCVFKCGSLRTFGPRNNAGTVATSTLLNSISTRYFFFSFLRFFFSVIYNSFFTRMSLIVNHVYKSDDKCKSVEKCQCATQKHVDIGQPILKGCYLIEIFYRQIQVGFPATEPLRKRSEKTRCEYAKSKFSGRLSGYFLDVSMVTTIRFLSIFHMTQKSFSSVTGTAECFNAFHLNDPNFLPVSIFILFALLLIHFFS